MSHDPAAHSRNDEPPADTRPYLCIPYWTTPVAAGGTWDTGQERPLPAAVCSYLCDSIHASPYTPGQPLNVTVDVRNSGNGNATAIATVIVYWADPTIGFAHPNYFAATAIAVPTDRSSASSVTTPTMTATIPATAPDHICLVVAVTHPQDLAGTVCDPINDRHWAQRNLQAVPAAGGDPIKLRLNAANPFAEGRLLVLQIRAADNLHAARVASELGTEPVALQTRLQLLDPDGRRLGDTTDSVRTELELRAHEVRTFQLLIEPEQEVPAGRSSALEAELVDPRNKEAVVGSLGIALLNGNKA